MGEGGSPAGRFPGGRKEAPAGRVQEVRMSFPVNGQPEDGKEQQDE